MGWNSNPENVKVLREEVANGGTLSDIRERFSERTGIVTTEKVLSDVVSKLGMTKVGSDPKPKRKTVEKVPVAAKRVDLPEDEEDEVADDVIRDLQRSRDQLLRQNRKLVAFGDDLLSVCRTEIRALKPPVMILPKPSSRKDKYHEVAWLNIFDVQIGSFIDSNLTSGIASYSFEIFKARLERLLKRFLSIIEEQRTDRRQINQCVIVFGGDIVDGENIFPGHAFQIDIPAFTQMIEGSDLFAQFVSRISQEFTHVKVICVDGNHGRPGKKGDNHPKTNFDRILYHMMAKQLQHHKNVSVHIASGHMAIMDLFGYNFLISHGDEFKGQLSIPAYGMMRAARNYTSMARIPIDVFVHGHHHNPTDIDVSFSESYICGSFQGGSMLSVKNMQTACQPSQLLFFVHPKNRVTSKWKITLEDLPQLKADSHGFMTPMLTIGE